MVNVNNGIVVSNFVIEFGKFSVCFKELINFGIIVIGKCIFVVVNIILSVK